MLALGERSACAFPHQTIVISKTLQKYCRYRFDHEAVYIPNGVSPATAENPEILKQFGLEEKKYIVAVSRLIRHKGIHTLINAYNIVAKKNVSLPKLVIVGAGSDTDDYVKEVKTLAQGNSNIIFTSMQSGADLNTLFKSAGIFVQPSEAEGLSIALLEGMAYGVPSIISNIEENQEPAEGFALEFINKSVEDLASKLEYALAHPAEMAELAKQAKLRTETEYDWNNIAKATGQTYLELAGLKLVERTQLS
jgi:glycosyltransferase involved in cell wall biosynthesis